MQDTPKPVVLFDGVCSLCSASVQWIIKRDGEGQFRFAAVGSAAAGKLLAASGFTGAVPDSVVLVHGGKVYVESDAVIGIARQLGWPWKLAAAFLVLPKSLRDWLYRQVARRRYRWFGRRESCWMPTPELRGRFLDDDA